MLTMRLLVLICIVLSLVATVHSADPFSYNNQDQWGGECQIGKMQSPIALYRSSSYKKEFTPLILEGYKEKNIAILKNNGHSAEVRIRDAIPPKMKGGGLPEHYTFDHLHFHWQSEHTIEGYRYPLEVHLVHYATIHSNLANATKFPNGIAVLGALYDLSPDDDEESEELIKVIKSLHGDAGVDKVINDFVIREYIPRDTAGFFRYNGSLTTPNCNEVVVWSVFTNTLPISRNQVKVFETLQAEGNEVLVRNYRKLQPVNGRDIFLKESPSSGLANKPRSLPLIAIIIGMLLMLARLLLD